VQAANGVPDEIDCGKGTDRAEVDFFDSVVECEEVRR